MKAHFAERQTRADDFGKLDSLLFYQAIGTIYVHGGRIENWELAEELGRDPRGLRQLLERCPHIKITFDGPEYRHRIFYQINTESAKCPAITKEEP